jgi:hypothetical protein
MPDFTPFNGQVGFGWRSEIVGGLKPENYCSLHNRAGKLPTPHVLGRNREGLLLAFSGVPIYAIEGVMNISRKDLCRASSWQH